MLYRFDNFVLDAAKRELRRGNVLVAVEPKAFDVIEYLIANRDRVVSKDALLAAVWNGRITSESALTTCINAARTAIGDSGDEQRLIRTLPRKGLRFVGDVDQADASVANHAFQIPPPERDPPRAPAADDIRPALAVPERPSIAVLPFANMSDEKEQEYFADGVADDIITALSRFRSFLVIARNSSFTYKIALSM